MSWEQKFRNPKEKGRTEWGDVRAEKESGRVQREREHAKEEGSRQLLVRFLCQNYDCSSISITCCL